VELERVLQSKLDNQAQTSQKVKEETAKLPLTILILKAIKRAPLTLIEKSFEKLLKTDNKGFWKTIKLLSGLSKPTTTAHGFNAESLAASNLSNEYSPAQYIKELYTETEANKLDREQNRLLRQSTPLTPSRV